MSCSETIPRQMVYHFECPHPTDPDLDLALNTVHILKLDALPPASPGWLSPEQKELLRHSNCIVVGGVSFGIGSEFSQRKAADDRLVRFRCTMTPSVVTIESAAKSVSCIQPSLCPTKLTLQSTSRSGVALWSQPHRSSSSQKIYHPD